MTRPPPLDGLSLSWVDRPGVRLCVRTLKAEQPPRPPLLLLHGFPDAWFGWSGLIEALRPAAQDLIVPDLRGYADSPADPAVARFDLETLVADVWAIADASGADQIDLMGGDWGGVIAWACAQKAPQRLKSLCVLNAPHPHILAQSLSTNHLQRARSAYIRALQSPDALARLPQNGFAALEAAFASAEAAGARSEAVKTAYRTVWGLPGRLEAMLAYYRAATFLTDAAMPWRPGAAIPVPTLMIWGERDEAFAPDLPEAHEALAASLTIARCADLGHWPQHEAPARVAALWRQWRALID